MCDILILLNLLFNKMNSPISILQNITKLYVYVRLQLSLFFIDFRMLEIMENVRSQSNTIDFSTWSEVQINQTWRKHEGSIGL